LADMVGFDFAIATGTPFVHNFPERSYKSMLIPLMQQEKRAGISLLLKMIGYLYQKLLKLIGNSLSISEVRHIEYLIKMGDKV
jgi:hypothetical protein